jgi:hypothetical protein
MSNEYEIISNLIRFVTIREITSEYPDVMTLNQAQKKLNTFSEFSDAFKYMEDAANGQNAPPNPFDDVEDGADQQIKVITPQGNIYGGNSNE